MEWWRDDKAIAALVAIGGVLGAVLKTGADAFSGRRAARATAKRGLSESEAAFREAVLARLSRSERRGDALERAHHECLQKNVDLERKVDELQDQVSELKVIANQPTLPLGAPGAAR